MKFAVIMSQEEEGCDYTIGCGISFEIVEAESIEEVKESVKYPEGKDEYSIFRREDIRYDRIIIIPLVDSFCFDIDKEYKQENELKMSEKEEKERIKDEEEFLKLKAKLNK